MAELEVEHLARDGRRVRKEVRALLLEVDGELVGAMFATDCTERARQQAARAECVRMLGTTLDLFPGWVARIDDDMRDLYANEPFAPPVLADRMRLRQVLLNLLSNAVKYNRPGGPLGVSSRRTEPCGLELRVADGGPGLAID